MKAATFVTSAWGKRDDQARKAYVRAHWQKVPIAELEAEIVALLDKHGWNVGVLMVAQRVLQVYPSGVVLLKLRQMLAEGATEAPDATRTMTWLRNNLRGLMDKQPALAPALVAARAAARARAGANPRRKKVR